MLPGDMPSQTTNGITIPRRVALRATTIRVTIGTVIQHVCVPFCVALTSSLQHLHSLRIRWKGVMVMTCEIDGNIEQELFRRHGRPVTEGGMGQTLPVSTSISQYIMVM